MMKKFTKNSLKAKIIYFVFLLILTLQILPISKVSAQFISTEKKVVNAIKIVNVEAISETKSGLLDGKIIVTIENETVKSSSYRLSYDLHSAGNNFISPILSSVNNKLTLTNARLGNYYNLKVVGITDNTTSVAFSNFKIENAPHILGTSASSNRTATLCSSTINYNDCNGTAKSISNCNTGSAYNDANVYRPCGVEIGSACNVFAINQWHCINGNLSAPPNQNEYTPTDYIGVGLTALQASRINWIVCNYTCFASGVDHAIWYIAGTGGLNNTIAQAAVSAIPSANGTQSLMIFYKSLNGSYQNMVQWQCRTTANCTCPNNLVTNPSFENGTNGWNWSGGTLNAGNGAIACGNYSGDFQITNNSSNWVSQTVGTDLVAGTVINASVYAGTHDNSVNHYVGITFFDANWNYLSASVSVVVNKVLANAPAGPQLYNLTATVPANAKYTQVNYGGSGGWIKTDNWCVTSTPPAATGSVGNFVWNDANGNGIQDIGESGLNGVTIQLKNSVGTVIATTTSDANGFYQFTGLAADSYSVVFLSVAGYGISPAFQGADATKDSNVDGNGIATVTIGVGESNQTIDAGFCPITLALGNRVWYDVNNNGINDTENGIPSVTVYLYKDNNNDNIADGPSIATTTTDANGYYLFSNLVPGNYIVGVVTPVGYEKSSINGGDPDNDINLDNNGINTIANETRGLAITLIGGTEPDGTNTNTNTNITYDFGFYATPTGSIGDRVWFDANGNGIQDAAETTPLTGVTVQLKNVAGIIIATTTTNATGNYLFSGLSAGNYTVVFPVSISGATVTTANVGADDNVDSDADQTTGETGTIILATGQNITNVDAGYCPTTLALGDRVYYDLNNNGVREAATEAGIPSLTVNLYKDNNNDNIPDGASIATTTTDANGGYRFDNLVPGNYIVGVTPPASYTSSTNAAIDPDNDVDLDDNGTNLVGTEWRGLAITLTGGGEPLETGNFNNTYDFGFYQQSGSIGNFVWNDTNGNGVQDAGEAGIAGVTVNLLNAAGTIIATTTTNASGIYNFANVAPGTYTVTFTTPAGYTPTGSNLGGNDNTDSDPIAGTVTGVVVTAGTANNTVDAGFFLPAALGNFVWNDVNANGIQDAGEVGINAVTVNLLNAAGTVIVTTTTNASGAYSFTNLAPGTYGVSFATPAGYTASPSNVTIAGATDANDSDPVAGTVTGITLTSGQTDNTIDAGFYQSGSIGNFVWNDTNGNGVQDAGEQGINGAIVNLLNAAGTVIATTTTNASGIYNFANVAPGTYTVTFTTPAGYTPTGSNLGGNDNTDSDPIAGTVTGVVVTAGTANNTIDAGFYLPAAIGNFVWNDVNANGIQDAGEVGINAVTVNLLNAAGTVIATTTTNASGAYSFTNLAPGTYGVSFATPAGYTTSPSNVTTAGATDANDSDPVGGTVTGIVLISGQTDNTIDAGFYQTGSIGNFVWNDTNGNGIQDAGEPGISGATVKLTFPNGTTSTTITNASGIYSFTNLLPGTYSVAFTTPIGYSNASTPNLGGNDNTDSDPIGGIVSGIVLAPGQIDNSVDAGFYNCQPITSGINGPLTICAAESALFTATGAGSGSVYTWAFMSGTPATAIGTSVTSTWSTPGEYDITLTVTKNGCSATYLKSIVITQSVFAGAGPDADICSGSSTTLNGSGPAGSNYSWTIVSGDPTSIDNGANQQSVLVSPLVTTTYQLTVTQNGCTRTDQVTVFINVNKNPTANAGSNKVTFINVPVAIGGSPTGTAPLATPGASLGYIWSASTGLNSNTVSNPTVTLPTPGLYNYQVIVYSILTGCSDTATVSVNVLQPLNLGDRVWYDKNNNGTQDAAEPGVVGVVVNLYADADGNNIPDGAAIATTTTIANGIYNFPALLAGKYIVGAVIPTGYTAAATTATSATPDNDNNTDNNAVTTVSGELRTNFITLSVDGEPSTDGDGINGNLTVDLGITGTAGLGNFVWEDLNKNGLQDAGEPGIQGATVTLTYPDASTASTTTNISGKYNFTGLLAGTYSVAFTTPSGGYAATASNIGTNDAIDSDPIAGVVSNIILVNNQIDSTIDAGFYKLLSLSGNVWHDINGMSDNLVNNTAPLQVPTPGALIPTGLRICRVDANTGLVVSNALVSGTGTYNFPNVASGNYILILSTTPGVPGQAPPFATLPTGWLNTGEKLGTTPGRDALINGKLSVSVTTSNVINANFGILLNNDDIGIN